MYEVSLEHPCYEPANFSVRIALGEEYTFDKKLVPLLGHVTINAERDGEPQSVPVYVNGKKVGSTPYSDNVPVCADITVDEDRWRMPVEILAHDYVEWTYEVPSKRKRVLGNSRSSRSDSGSMNRQGDTDNTDGHKIIVQGLGFLGAQIASENDYGDSDMLGYFAADILLSVVKFGSYSLGVGLGFGIVDHEYYVADEYYQGGYTLYNYSGEPVNSYSVAPNAIVEGTVHVSEYLMGVRYMCILHSDYFSSRFSGFFEMPELMGMGMEMGFAATDSFGDGFFLSFTIRLPSWKSIRNTGWFKSL